MMNTRFRPLILPAALVIASFSMLPVEAETAKPFVDPLDAVLALSVDDLALKMGNPSEAGMDRAARLWATAKRVSAGSESGTPCLSIPRYNMSAPRSAAFPGKTGRPRVSGGQDESRALTVFVGLNHCACNVVGRSIGSRRENISTSDVGGGGIGSALGLHGWEVNYWRGGRDEKRIGRVSEEPRSGCHRWSGVAGRGGEPIWRCEAGGTHPLVGPGVEVFAPAHSHRR